MIGEEELYFERQGTFSSNCGLHALNNLLGGDLFSKQHLDAICAALKEEAELTGNSMKHFLGGDYDVSVLIRALQDIKVTCNWLDNRRQFRSFHSEDRPLRQQLKGYLVNTELKSSSAQAFFKDLLKFSGRHWVAVRLCGERYFLLDSKREKPILLGKIEDFVKVEMEKQSHVIEVVVEEQP